MNILKMGIERNYDRDLTADKQPIKFVFEAIMDNHSEALSVHNAIGRLIEQLGAANATPSPSP